MVGIVEGHEVSLMNQMKIIDKIFRRGAERARSVAAERRSVTVNRTIVAGDMHERTVSSAREAMSLAVVHRCVRFVSESVSSLPLCVLSRDGDGVFREGGEGARLQYLLGVSPNEQSGAVEFWSAAVRQMLLSGNAYIVPRRWSTAPYEWMELRLVSPDAAVTYDRIGERYRIYDFSQGIDGTYSEGELIRLSCPSYDGTPVGVGILDSGRLALSTVATADREMLRRFSNGCMPTGFITNPRVVEGYGETQDEELDRLADDLRYNMRRGDTLNVLYGNAEFKPVQMTAADAQFVQNREYALRDICRFFGVHPSFVFDDTSSNYKSAEMANVAFLSNTLNPLLRQIENELQRKLLTRSEAGRMRIRFDRRELYACDLDGKARYMTSLLQNGIASVNDLRRAEGHALISGGDTALVSANYRRLDELTDEVREDKEQDKGEDK